MSWGHPDSANPGLRKFLTLYAADWIVTGALSLLFYYISHRISGFKRHFSLADASLLYPYAVHQRIGTNALRFISVVVPFVAQLIINLATVRSWVDLHHSTLGLLLAIAMTGSVTQIVKATVGRPRPDLISRCQPFPGSVDPTHGLSTVAVCTQTAQHILEDGWRSFPSGHSSMSFAGLGFLTFYLAGKLHLFDTRGHASKVWLTLIPLSAAALVAISRTMDYRHHWHDVVAGSILGLSLAYFAYRQYYPSLEDNKAHLPYMTRFEESVDYSNDVDISVYRDGVIDAHEGLGLAEENVGLFGANGPRRSVRC